MILLLLQKVYSCKIHYSEICIKKKALLINIPKNKYFFAYQSKINACRKDLQAFDSIIKISIHAQ